MLRTPTVRKRPYVGVMDEHANDTPWEPPFSGSESEHLLGALDRLRWTFRWKADELDAAGLDTRIGPPR